VVLVGSATEASALLEQLRNGADLADNVISMAVGEQTSFPAQTSRGFLIRSGRRATFSRRPVIRRSRARLEQEIRAEAVKEISAALTGQGQGHSPGHAGKAVTRRRAVVEGSGSD